MVEGDEAETSAITARQDDKIAKQILHLRNTLLNIICGITNTVKYLVELKCTGIGKITALKAAHMFEFSTNLQWLIMDYDI